MASRHDSEWMARALRLAERGLYTTSPNPRVGCVLVREGQMLGEGYTQPAGQNHAEIEALIAAKTCGVEVRGATAYVSLEPCSHFGRTPPCADALIQAGLARVVVAMQDPNPLVAGKGIEKLRAAGIEVECGLMEAAARELNLGFCSRMTHAMPWLRSKVAASLDGGTALANGTSKWITGAAARQDVQHWRARSCAVLTGIGTVLADDPQLNVRKLETTRQPLRAVMDSGLRMPPDARLLQQPGLLVYTTLSDSQKIGTLERSGARVVVLPESDGHVDAAAVLRHLATLGCNEVLVEAGSRLNGSLLKAGLVDELVLYLAPQMMGDMARGVAKLGELTNLEQCIAMEWQDVRQVDRDLRIVARVIREKN